MNKTIELTLLTSQLKDDMLLFFQSAMTHGAAALVSAETTFPIRELITFDDYEGPLWIASWKGLPGAVIRTKCRDTAEHQALEICQKTGDPFAAYDPMDPKQKHLFKSPSGRVVTKEFLNLEQLNKNNAGLQLKIKLRVYENDCKEKGADEENHEEESGE